MNLVEIAETVSHIARRAGEAVLNIYEREEDFEVEEKEDDSPLTEADRKANRIICDSLEELELGFPIVSEENKEVPYEERKDYEYFWLVDPLDGTKEFIKRNDEFTINIALVLRQRPVMGVVYVPVSDELYWAVDRAGAFLAKGGEVFRIQAASFQMSDEGLRVVTSRSHLNEATREFVDGLKAPETVARGSSLKFIVVANGQAHLYPRLGPTMEWDTGAAQIILEEAGGKVLVESSGEPLRYNKKDLKNPNFIAYGDVKEDAG